MLWGRRLEQTRTSNKHAQNTNEVTLKMWVFTMEENNEDCDLLIDNWEKGTKDMKCKSEWQKEL